MTLKVKKHDSEECIIFGQTFLKGLTSRFGKNLKVEFYDKSKENGTFKNKNDGHQTLEIDRFSGLLLEKAARQYLMGISSSDSENEIELSEHEIELSEHKFTQLFNVLHSEKFKELLVDTRKSLDDIMKEVSEANPGNEKLVKDIMQEAMIGAATAGLEEKGFDLKKFLQDKSINNQNLKWSDKVIKDADNWATRFVSWLKRTFENLFQKKGLGNDTYRKCSLVDDYVSRNTKSSEGEEAPSLEEAGNLLKEYYIRSVNEELNFNTFLEDKKVFPESENWGEIIKMNTQVTTNITNRSDANYKSADSKIYERYQGYQNIAKQLNEQKFYQVFSKKSNDLESTVGSTLQMQGGGGM